MNRLDGIDEQILAELAQHARATFAEIGERVNLSAPAVKRRVEDPSLPQADLAALAKEAHEKICPYSHATRNNVDVQIEVKGA